MKKESIFYNSKFLMLLSLLIAFFAWIFIVQSSEDKQTKIVHNVPVTMQEVDESIGKLGLSTIAAEQQKVSVQVEGIIYDVGGLKAEDIEVKPDISRISTAGTYDVELKATVKDTNKQVTVVGVTPRTVQLKFDSIATKELDIKVNLSGLSAPEDYLIGNISVSPRKIVLKGPEEDLSRVAQCVIVEELTQQLTSNYSEVLPVKLLDSEGNRLELRYVTADLEEAHVTIPVLKKKVVPVNLTFINIPEGFPVEQLKFEISNDEIEVAGPENQIDRYTQVELGIIDIQELDLDSVYAFDVKLPSGYVNTKNIKTIQVKFDSEGMVSKKFNVTNIQVTNQPLNYQVHVTSEEITDVEIIGPKDQVDNLLAGSIVAELDFSESSSIESGQIELPVKVYVPGKGVVWAKGDYRVIVAIQDLSQAEETEEDAQEEQ